MTTPLILGPWRQRGTIHEREPSAMCGAMVGWSAALKCYVINVWTRHGIITSSRVGLDDARAWADALLVEHGVILRPVG